MRPARYSCAGTARAPRTREGPAMPTELACPSCDLPLRVVDGSCTHCGVRLDGPTAGRLWQVDQQLAGLRDERAALLDRLRRESPGGSIGTGLPVGTARP